VNWRGSEPATQFAESKIFVASGPKRGRHGGRWTDDGGG
jgi:hypothetical protein